MKEIFSAFGSEVFRPLATIVIPGALAISSWFVVLTLKFESLRRLVVENHTETAIILALASMCVGLLVEDMGARVESRIFDPCLKKKTGFEGHSNEWNQYLRLAFKTEPVGQRYLRSIMLRFKFETGAAFAFLLAGPGLFCTGIALSTALWGFLGCCVLAAYLLYEARCSHRLLSETRREILKGAVSYPASSLESFDPKADA
jgi:hypothetical protein